MRNSYWLVTFLLVLECVVLLIEPTECFLNFIPVSVHTALQLLTLIVKIKSIIFKILLGLKLMGVEGFIWRRRRRSITSEGESNSYLDLKMGSLPESQRTELLMAWGTLERLVGQSIHFREDTCVEATNTFGKRPVTIWDGTYLISDTNAINHTEDEVHPSVSTAFKSNYSHWVSAVLGSALGSPYACHILEKELHLSSLPSSAKDAKTDMNSNSLLQTGAFR